MSNEIISFQSSNIENIKDLIYEVRGQKVMLDNDLAEMMEGYDCAKYLVNYCVEREIHTPRFICQSSNQPAVENITALINNYNKFISALD